MKLGFKPIKPSSPNQRDILLVFKSLAAKPACLIIDAETQASDYHEQLDLSQLALRAQDNIYISIPSNQVLLTQAALPRLNSYRLQQALPFALEEQVIADIDDLHFAAGPYSKEVNDALPLLPAAIIQKTQMDAWLTLLQTAGVQADVLLPDIFLLPYQAKQWQIHLDQDQACVRTGLYSGFSCEHNNLELLLSAKIAEEGKPESLLVLQEKGGHLNLAALDIKISTQELSSKQWLNTGLNNIKQFPPLNLLQASYLPAHKIKMPEKNKKAWRLAAYALGLCLSIMIISKLGSWMILAHEHHHLQNLIQETYQANFPNSPQALDPRTKLEAKLKRVLGQNERNPFLQYLGVIAKLTAPVRIQSLHFQNKQLNLEVNAASFSNLDDFVLALKNNGLEVKQQNANLTSNQVKATIIIEGKHS